MAVYVVLRAMKDARGRDPARAIKARLWLLSDECRDLLGFLGIVHHDRLVTWVRELAPVVLVPGVECFDRENAAGGDG